MSMHTGSPHRSSPRAGSPHPGSPRRHLASLLLAGASTLSVLAAATLGASTANAGPTANQPRHRSSVHLPAGIRGAGSLGLGTLRSAADKVDHALVGAKGPVDVMLELDASTTSRAFALARARGVNAARNAARAQTATIRRAQAGIEAHFGSRTTQARTLYRTYALYAGIAVRTDAAHLAALAALPGVKAIHRLTPKSPTNSTSVPLIGAPTAWIGRAGIGRGVRMGIIDTGIDYTHADFGGPGTTAAYAAAKASTTFIPTAKVVGGYDFAGDAYDADPTSATYHPAATPDPNPLDCDGHGTHVAATAAGLGVTTAGTTYSGGYSNTIDPASLSIGPGVAPGAKLYALKIFGCTGSTNLVGQALNWAADPNGDGDVSDHLDVVNLSLGSSFGSPDDPDAVAANNLAALGTVVVASMGNSGDVYEVGGSPANARRVVGVAASDDGNDVVDGLKIDSPLGIEPADTIDGHRDNVFAALKSVAYDWASKPGITDTEVVEVGAWGQVPADANNTDGCTAYSAGDQATITGKIVLQNWPGRGCGSADRAANARAAGAVGVIYGSDVNSFSSGVTGDATIPAMLTVNQATTAIRAQLEATPPVVVQATMTDALRNSVVVRNPGAVDQVASFSSRGIGIAGTVKPDVTAPGVTTFSAAAGTGNEGIAESGTSMASPHVTGEAALVRGLHPTWTVEQVKAAIMNTATQDLFVGARHTGPVYGPERVGSGRVKVDAAVATTTLAYVKDDPGSVSVSFGPVAVTAPTTTLRKTVTIVNTRPVVSASYAVSYQAAHPAPGVAYSFSPSQVSVPARGSVTVTVTETITRSALRAVSDPTTAMDPLGLGIDRGYRADASGRMVLTPTGSTSGPALRVPVWSAPRAASAMAAAATATVGGSGPVRTGALALAGTGIDQGSGTTGYLSTVSTFQLQATSARIASCGAALALHCIALTDDRAADLRYVGSASDAPRVGGLDQATLSFGISTYGPWRAPASAAEFDVLIDTNGDGTADAMVYNTRISTTDDYDYFLAELVDLRPGPGQYSVIDDQLLNNTDGSFDTNLFNSDSLALPVSAGALHGAGLIADSTSAIHYWVESYTLEGGQIDSIGSGVSPMTLTLRSPGLAAYGNFDTLVSDDLPGLSLAVRRDDASSVADKPQGLLLLHHLNTDGVRAQVVPVRLASSTTLTSSATTFGYGVRPTLTATLAPAAATGSVTFRDGTRVLGTIAVSRGRAALRVPVLVRGTHRITATYTGSAVYAPSAGGVTLTVR